MKRPKESWHRQPLPSPRRVGCRLAARARCGCALAGSPAGCLGLLDTGEKEELREDTRAGKQPRRHGETTARAACGPREPRRPAPSHVRRGSS